MSDTTTKAAKEYLVALSKIEGLTASQLLEVIKSIRLVNMLYPPQVQRDGLIRVTCMLEDHVEVLRILGK